MKSKLWFILSIVFALIILAIGSYVYFMAPELLEIPLDIDALESSVMTLISSFGGVGGLYLIISNQLKAQNQLALDNGKISVETYNKINSKLDAFIEKVTASQTITETETTNTNVVLTQVLQALNTANENETKLLNMIAERDAKINAILGSEQNESET